MTTHELKSWPDYFEPLAAGIKTFELRRNDRNFQVGDILVLREYDDRKRVYTGRECRKRITYMLDGIGQGLIEPIIGLNRGFAILQLVSRAWASTSTRAVRSLRSMATWRSTSFAMALTDCSLKLFCLTANQCGP
jgi:hypothetical protein